MDTASAARKKKMRFSTKAFIRGLGVVCILLLLGVAWIYLSSGQVENNIRNRLASQTVIIEWETEPVPAPGETPATLSAADQVPDGEAIAPPDIPENIPETPEETAYSAPPELESGLKAAPINGLHEDTSFGRKPVIRENDGLTAFQAYRRPFDIYASDKPIIAIAITGLGLSDVATESAVRSMPPEISFIMSPYSETLDFWTNESRARGHEIWLSLPVETKDYPLDDPGPHTMLVSAPERENQLKLEWLLSRTSGYIGFVTSYQPLFMSAANDMRPVVGNIYNSGLGFVDGSHKPATIPQSMAAGMKAPYSVVDIWLDMPDSSQNSLKRSLKQLEEKARQQGFAVGVIHPLPVSYQQILEWIETLPGKGFELAPLSATTGM